MKKGIEYFTQAITLDPEFALAYTGLSDSYLILSWYGWIESSEAYPLAKAAVRKALELDPHLAEAHVSLGGILDAHDWEFAAAEREYKRAIELNPNHSMAYFWHAWLLAQTGRPEEAITQIKKAKQLDPLSRVISTGVGIIYFMARRFDEAIAEYRKALELYPDYGQNYYELSKALAAKGDYPQAVTACENAIKLSPSDRDLKLQLAYLSSLLGKHAEARKILNEWASGGGYDSPYFTAMVYVGLGDKEQAFALLEKAYENRTDGITGLKVDAAWDPIRSDPRFADLIRRIGLPL